MRIVIVVFFCLLLSLVCYFNTGDDNKNMLGFRSYPDNIQEACRNDKNLRKIVPPTKSIANILISNFILFTILFSIAGIIFKKQLNFNSFMDAFIYFTILGEVLNLYDLVIIDLLWWRNTPRIRFSIISDKQAYQDPKKHVDSFLRGIILYILVGLVVAFIVRLF